MQRLAEPFSALSLFPPSVTPTVVTGMCEYGKHEQRVRIGDVEIFEFKSEASDSQSEHRNGFYSDQRAQRSRRATGHLSVESSVMNSRAAGGCRIESSLECQRGDRRRSRAYSHPAREGELSFPLTHRPIWMVQSTNPCSRVYCAVHLLSSRAYWRVSIQRPSRL